MARRQAPPAPECLSHQEARASISADSPTGITIVAGTLRPSANRWFRWYALPPTIARSKDWPDLSSIIGHLRGFARVRFQYLAVQPGADGGFFQMSSNSGRN